MTSIRSRILISLPLLALIGCGAKEVETKNVPVRTVNAETAIVTETDAATGYEATGTVRSVLNATLASKVMARVTRVNVREGDACRKGQILVELDGRELGSAVSMAAANYRASVVGVKNASTAAEMEAKTSLARIAQAEAQVSQSKAALAAANSRLDLAIAGPRTQERNQAHLAVEQAKSGLNLAKTELDRATQLVEAGAIARRQLDIAQNVYEQAKAQYDTAVEGEKMAIEGSRSQDIQAARDAVRQAEGAQKQAEAGLAQARAAAMQVKVRNAEIDSAKAQANQSSAALQSAQVGLAYATITAPFDGRVTQRMADPGAMAGPGAGLLTVEGGEYRLEANVPESVLPTVHPGSSIAIKLEAIGREIDGLVSEIAPRGDATSHTFLIKIALPAVTGIKSGMFGRARFPVAGSKAITVPSSATWEREGLHYIFAVDKGGIARLRIVTLGSPHGDSIEVLSGLTRGERIVTNGRDQVADGDKVKGN